MRAYLHRVKIRRARAIEPEEGGAKQLNYGIGDTFVSVVGVLSFAVQSFDRCSSDLNPIG
jgi:hypothetical protein